MDVKTPMGPASEEFKPAVFHARTAFFNPLPMLLDKLAIDTPYSFSLWNKDGVMTIYQSSASSSRIAVMRVVEVSVAVASPRMGITPLMV